MAKTLINGIVTVSSSGSESIEWKIQNFLAVLKNREPFEGIESPSFSYKNISYKFFLLSRAAISGGLSARSFLLRIIQRDNAEDKTHLIHRVEIRKQVDSVYKFVKSIDNNFTFVLLESAIQEHKNTVPEKRGVIFSVECHPNKDTGNYTSSGPSSLIESDEISSPSSVKSEASKNNGFCVLCKHLTDAYLKEEHCDITIHVGEQLFKTHKFILSARSPVFAVMLQHDMTEKKTNSVNINDCEPGVFKEFLLYLYSGKVETLSNENVVGLYTVADKYNVDCLKLDCVNYMKSNLSADTFCDFIEIAAKHDESELIEVSKEYFTKYTKKILLSTNWQSFLKENSVIANELFLLTVSDN